jgi:hypothetical protein
MLAPSPFTTVSVFSIALEIQALASGLKSDLVEIVGRTRQK